MNGKRIKFVLLPFLICGRRICGTAFRKNMEWIVFLIRHYVSRALLVLALV